MKPASPRPFSFDARSVMLFAALTVGGAASLQAQSLRTPSRAQAAPTSQASAAAAPVAAPARRP